MKKILILFLFVSIGVSAQTGDPCPTVTTLVTYTDGTILLEASPGFDSYIWTPSMGLSDSTIANPFVTGYACNSTYIVDAISFDTNLIVNGDFSLGDVDFSSGLTSTTVYSPGDYHVGTDYFIYTGIPDHTPTTDNFFMAIDGSTTLATLWETSVAVIPENYYQFSFYASRADAVQPQFEVHFIGDVTGEIIVDTLDGIPYVDTWTWDQYVVPMWNSTTNTSLTIKIVNLELDSYGNDFALDDMSLIGEKCRSVDTAVVVIPTPPPPVVSDLNACLHSILPPLNASGQNLLWYTGPGAGSVDAPTPSSEVAGAFDYYVTQTINGCESDSANIHLQIFPIPSPPDLSDTSVCLNQMMSPLSAVGENIVWYLPEATSGTSIPPVPATSAAGVVSYYATQTVDGCTSDSAGLTMTVTAPPLFDLGGPYYSPCVNRVPIKIGPSEGWQYLWDDEITTSPREITVTVDTMFILTASNECGSYTDTALVAFEDCNCYFYLPNSFTPNGDGINDEYKPVYSCVFESYKMMIFNRFGEMVFESESPAVGWSGKYKNSISEEGVYVVKINYKPGREYSSITKEIIDKVTLVR